LLLLLDFDTLLTSYMGIDQITASSLNQTILPFLVELFGWVKSTLQRRLKPGMYEVLDYATTLDIHDPMGKSASFTKFEWVRFLQDNVIAYQDQAWGDGKILLNYQCAPGIPVDRYRNGHKTYVVISLREVKNKGDRGDFYVSWDIQNGFLSNYCFWGTDIDHATDKVSLRVILPKERPPIRVIVSETNSGKSSELPKRAINELPDGKWQITWEKNYPRLYEHYILRWKW
jgi:hypothetical protein